MNVSFYDEFLSIAGSATIYVFPKCSCYSIQYDEGCGKGQVFTFKSYISAPLHGEI